jgi:uncharacterized protein YjbJ (UPF0337 family)/ElaB/YqjD/DUF883 family membrane-anchored ribosome-binding protein
MDTQIAKGSIKELKGELKKTWSKLTDDDLTYLEGGSDTIVGKVQKAYGYTKDRAQQEFDSFKRNNSSFFQDNLGTNNQENRMPTNSSTSQFNSGSSSNSAQLDPNRIKNKAQHMINEDIMEPAQEYMSRAREFGVKAMERGSEYAKENPGYAVLGAAAVGFLLGAMIVRRR